MMLREFLARYPELARTSGEDLHVEEEIERERERERGEEER